MNNREHKRLSTFDAHRWPTPSVKEVEELMISASRRLGCNVFDLYHHFDGDARTFRRWKENVDKTPDAPSSIKPTAYGLLVALAHDKLIFTDDGQPLEPVNSELWHDVTYNHVYTADKFVRPSEDIVKCFIGPKSISGKTRKEVAELIGFDKDHFGRVIGHMNFGVWASLLLCFGLPLHKVFRLAKPE